MDTLVIALLLCVIGTDKPDHFKEVPKDACVFEAKTGAKSPFTFYWVDTTAHLIWDVRVKKPE